MPKAQSKGCQRKNSATARSKWTADWFRGQEGYLQDSCSTLGLTKNAIDEKIAAFFEDRAFFYDIENAPWGDRAYIVRCPYSNRRNCMGIVRFFGVQKYNKIVRRPYCNRTTIVRSATGARTMLPTMDLQATMPTTNRNKEYNSALKATIHIVRWVKNVQKISQRPCDSTATVRAPCEFRSYGARNPQS